jgi:glycosyltransferase involved in cell wall biosynthesis
LRLTFIVSAYNRPVHLSLCLTSLILQTEPDWECIVTDNATDPTISAENQWVINSLVDPRISYMHTKTVDCYHSSEMAVPKAQGDWLAFPSDDSYLTPCFAEKMLAAGETGENCYVFQGERGPLDMVCCDFVWGREGTWLWCEGAPRICHIDKTTFIIRRDNMIPWPKKQPESIASDGHLAEEMMRRGARIGRVMECLVCHS